MATHNFLDKTGLGQLWAKIKALIVHSDWDEEDSTESSYIENKPPIITDSYFEGSILEGQLEPSPEEQYYVIHVTGNANVTSYSYTYDGATSLPNSTDLRRVGVAYYEPIGLIGIISINTTNNTIVFNKTLNADTAITEGSVTIYKSRKGAGENAHSEGYYSRAAGSASHAEGRLTISGGDYSHSEGWFSAAMGQYSHAEGYDGVAQGQAAHVEGWGCQTLNYGSHAEGYNTKALGVSSHSEGQYTTAQRKSQHVFGEYNVLDTSGTTDTRGTYVEIVGKGTANNARSNARTLDWNGNEVLAGKLTVGAAPTNNMDVATKQYVDNSQQVMVLTLEPVETEPTKGIVSNNPLYTTTKTHAEIRTAIDNGIAVILTIQTAMFYYSNYDRGVSDLMFAGVGYYSTNILLPCASESDYTWEGMIYYPIELHIQDNRISLEGPFQRLSYIDLPIYDGSISEVEVNVD